MITLQKIKAEETEEVLGALAACFDYQERREEKDFRRILCDPDYAMHHILCNGKRVGFISFWKLNGITFVEHFAIYQAQRGAGYGGETLALLQKKTGQILLEVEEPAEKDQIRRVKFYESHGFYKNPYPYFQPSYHADGSKVPMLLMSYPKPLADDSVIDVLYEKVYHTTREEIFEDGVSVYRMTHKAEKQEGVPASVSPSEGQTALA